MKGSLLSTDNTLLNIDEGLLRMSMHPGPPIISHITHRKLWITHLLCRNSSRLLRNRGIYPNDDDDSHHIAKQVWSTAELLNLSESSLNRRAVSASASSRIGRKAAR